MNFVQKIELFRRLGGNLVLFAVLANLIALGTWFFSSDAIVRYNAGRFSILFVLILIIGFWFIFLRVGKALSALNSGVRREAIVLGIYKRLTDSDSEQRLYLMWQDTDGYEGRSLSGVESDFSNLQKGDQIIIFREDKFNSWWERDLFG